MFLEFAKGGLYSQRCGSVCNVEGAFNSLAVALFQ